MLSHNGQPDFTFHLKEELKKIIIFDISDPSHDRKMKVGLKKMPHLSKIMRINVGGVFALISPAKLPASLSMVVAWGTACQHTQHDH